MLTRIYIDNFRCLTNFEFRPSQLDFFVGDNGTGKSTVLDALSIACRVASDPNAQLEGLLPGRTRTIWDSRPTQTLEVDARIAGATFRYGLRIRHADDGTPLVLAETVSRDGQVVFENTEGLVRVWRGDTPITTFQFSQRRTFLALLEAADAERDVIGDVVRLREHLSQVRVLRLDPFSMAATSAGPARRLLLDGSNFASWYQRFSAEHLALQGDYFRELAEILPGFTGLSFRQDGTRHTLLAAFKTKGSRQPCLLRFDELSEGQRVLVVLYALLTEMQVEPSTTFFDEPSAHVALGEIQPWLVELCERIGEGVQVGLVSHHPDIIDYMAARSAIAFRRPSFGPVVTERLTVDRDEGLRASDVVRKRLYADD